MMVRKRWLHQLLQEEGYAGEVSHSKYCIARIGWTLPRSCSTIAGAVCNLHTAPALLYLVWLSYLTVTAW